MDDLYQKLLAAAFRFLSFRPRSEKEIRDFLAKKVQKRKINDASVGKRVLERLRELGYIDDERFAAWWQEQRTSHRPKGMRAIAQELKAKGIEIKDITFDEVASAKHALTKKLPLWRKLPKLEEKKKLYGFLGRRGFSGETIHRVIDEAVDGRVQ